MFDLFKKNTPTEADDAKSIRDAVLQALKTQLRKAEGGEGAHIRGIQFFVQCTAEDKPVYESALYVHEEEKLRAEVRRLADDYAIGLPQEWKLEVSFADQLPEDAMAIAGTKAALFIATAQTKVRKEVTVFLHVVSGVAERDTYAIQSTGERMNIGREAKVQGSNGFYRINHIAFTPDGEGNKSISRQHAHIEFNTAAGKFYLYADEGGVPPRNKVKVLSQRYEAPIKLQSTQLGHALEEGDQILLGDVALLVFSYWK